MEISGAVESEQTNSFDSHAVKFLWVFGQNLFNQTRRDIFAGAHLLDQLGLLGGFVVAVV
jgi:hypothetical protein